MNIGFLNTIDSVYRTQVRGARKLGLRLGGIAVARLPEPDLTDVSEES